MLLVTVPLRLVNPLNGRQHWRAVSARGKKEKKAVLMVLSPYRNRIPPAPRVVTITRISAGTMDSDGYVASAKHVRDAIALFMGVDDKDSVELEWRYEQRRGPVKTYSIEIEIRTRNECA